MRLLMWEVASPWTTLIGPTPPRQTNQRIPRHYLLKCISQSDLSLIAAKSTNPSVFVMSLADETQPITIPALGKQIELGQFYDARTNTFYDGLSAWSAEEVEKTQIVRECPHTNFSFSTNNTERDESAGLDVEGSVSVKLKLFNASGSAQYLNSTKTHAYEARVDASCRVKTRERTMPSDQLMNWKYDEILKKPELTHFVSKVFEGGEAHLSFSQKCSNAEEETRIKGKLSGSIKALIASIEGSLDADVKKEIIESHQSCEVKLTCSYNPPHPVVTFEDAVDEASKLPQRLRGVTQTVTVNLLPIHTVDSSALRICRSLDERDMRKVSTLLDDLQQACLNLKNTKNEVVNEKWFPKVRRQVDGVEEQLVEADVAFRNVCTTILPKLRGSRASDDSTVRLKERLRKAIKEMQNAVALASRFVNAKKQEMQMVKIILEEAGDDVINDLASDKPRVHCLCLSLAEANTKKHAVKKKLRLCTKETISCIADAEKDISNHPESDSSSESDDDDDELAEWFENEEITENISKNIKLIKETMQANREGQVLRSMKFHIGRIAKIGKTAVSCGNVVVVDEKGSKSRAVFVGQPTGVVAREINNEGDQRPRVVLEWKNECDLPLEDNKCRITYWKICDDTDTPPDSADAGLGFKEKSVDVSYERAASASYYKVSLPSTTLEGVDGCYCGLSVQVFSKLVGLSSRSETTMLRTSRPPSIVSEIVEFHSQNPASLRRNGWELDKERKFLVVGRKQVHAIRDTKEPSKVAVVMVDVMPEYEPQIPFPGNDKDAIVVLMTGESGHGKSTHINGFFNWIFKISRDDPVRLLLVDDRKHNSSAKSVTDKITVYRIRRHRGCKLEAPLYLIDSPGFGDTRGIEGDKYVARTYRMLFSLITKINCVALAIKTNENRCGPKTRAVLNTILHQFGENVSGNIIALLTFADNTTRLALNALREVKVPFHQYVEINNSSFVCRKESSNTKFQELFWNLYETGNKGMFEAIKNLPPVPAKQSAQVTKERTELYEHLSFLRWAIIKSVNRGMKISGDLDIVRQSITAPPNAMFETTIYETEKVPLSPGKHTTLCSKCSSTCHPECMIAGNQKEKCWAMDLTGHCRICDCKGNWDVHFDENYRFESKPKKVKKYQKDVIDKWSDASKSVESTVLRLIEEFIREQKKIIDTVREMHDLHKRLCQIALRHNPKSISHYVESLIAEARARGSSQEVGALVVAKEVFDLSVAVGEGVDAASETSQSVMEKVKCVLEMRVRMTSDDRIKTQDKPSSFYYEVWRMLPQKYQKRRDVPEPIRGWLFRSNPNFKANFQNVISVIKVLLRDGLFAMFQER